MRLTERFSAEHRIFLQQLEMLEQLTGDNMQSDAVRSAVAVVQVPVENHAREEEERLFPELEPILGREAGPLAVMYADHEQITSLLQSIANQDGATLRNLCQSFIGLLREHISREDQVLFPFADRVLGDRVPME